MANARAARSLDLQERLQQQGISRSLLRQSEVLRFDQTVELLLDHFAPSEVQTLLTYHVDKISRELR